MARTRKPSDYAARNARSIAKHGKSLYERRIESAMQRGAQRQAARGHKIREHVERSRRNEIKYGAGTSRLARLRSAVVNHAVSVLGASGTKGQVNAAAIRAGLRMLHAEALEYMLTIGGEEWKQRASLQTYKDPDALEDLYAELEFGGTLREEDFQERNPFWYHA